jgi:hypothetical protein
MIGALISVPNYEQIEIDSHVERYCSLRLSKLIDSSDMNPSYYCGKCVIEYPTKADSKSKSRSSTPQNSNNEIDLNLECKDCGTINTITIQKGRT